MAHGAFTDKIRAKNSGFTSTGALLLRGNFIALEVSVHENCEKHLGKCIKIKNPSRSEEANQYQKHQNARIIDKIRIKSPSVAAAFSLTKHAESYGKMQFFEFSIDARAELLEKTRAK